MCGFVGVDGMIGKLLQWHSEAIVFIGSVGERCTQPAAFLIGMSAVL